MAETPGTERRCERCGMKLTFLEGKSGPDRAMPAQKVRSIYLRVGDRVYPVKVEHFELFVNHYETCPHASEFSGGGRGRAGAD